MRAGEVSKGATIYLPPVMEVAARLCDALPGAFGAFNVQMFHDAHTGEIAVIEINPRFGGGFPLAWRAGGKFPKWLVEHVAGLPSTVTEVFEHGVVMLRYDSEVFVRLEDTDLVP